MHTSLSPSLSLCLSMFVCETSTCGTPYTLKYHSQMTTFGLYWFLQFSYSEILKLFFPVPSGLLRGAAIVHMTIEILLVHSCC